MKLPLFSVSANAIRPNLNHKFTVKRWKQVIQSGRTDKVFIQAHKITLLGIRKKQIHIEDVFRFDSNVGGNQVNQGLIMLG